MAGWLEYRSWKYSVNAARRINPNWNEHQGFLYPARFYRRGWVEDDSSQSFEDDGSEEAKLAETNSDEIADFTSIIQL